MSSHAAILTRSTGSVYVERNGTRIALAEGEPVFSTDSVITDSNTTADLRFADGATARLSPGTRLDVRDFAYGEGDQSFVVNLAQGAMRSLSGEVVKQNPDAFKINTPQGNVGIRGTELFNYVSGGKEVHAVIFVDKGHIVVVTAMDGRNAVMDNALQSVTLNSGDTGQLLVQTFSITQMEELIRSLAPTLVDNLTKTEGAQTGNGGPEDDATSGIQTASSVVLITLDTTGAGVSSDIQEGLTLAGVDVQMVNRTALGERDEATLGRVLEVSTDSTGSGTMGNGSMDPKAPPAEADQPNTPLAPPSVPSEPATDAPTQPPTQPPTDAPTEPPTAPPTDAPTEPPTDAPTSPPAPPGPTSPPLVEHDYPGGIAASSGDGVAHIAPGVSPETPNRFVVTGTVEAPLVGNALNLGSKARSAFDPVESYTTADDVFIVDDLGTGAAYRTADGTYIVSGIYGDAVKVIVAGGHTLTLGNDNITVNGTVNGGQDSPTGGTGGLIYGDAQDITLVDKSTLVLGNDTIKVGTLINKGSIFGDAYTLTPGSNPASTTLTMGADKITVDTIDHQSGDVLVVGDVHTLTAFTGGNDVIHVGHLLNGNVCGDAYKLADTAKGGEDIITVATMSGGSLHGDAVFMAGSSGGGKDNITVTMLNGGTVNGDASQVADKTATCGGDIITVTTMTGGKDGSGNATEGTVNGDAEFLSGAGGADEITVGTLNAGTVNGDAGTVYASGICGKDTITVATMTGSFHVETTGSATRINPIVNGDAKNLSRNGGDDEIHVTNLSGGIICGDAQTMDAGLTGGADKIYINKMSEAVIGTPNNGNYTYTGRVYGDTEILNSATGGNDIIEVKSSMSAGDIFGDALIMNGTAQGGNDVISVIGTMSGGSIYGDASSINNSAKGGNDLISIGTLSGGHIYGDAFDISTSATGGNDKITITTLSGSNIHGDANFMSNSAVGGDDVITVTTMTDGNIYGDATIMRDDAVGGDDVITVTTMTGGKIYGDGDTMSITYDTDGKPVESGNAKGGNDTIHVTTMTGGEIYGDGATMSTAVTGGKNTITVDTMSGGKIEGGSGEDTITVDTMSGGKIEGGSGNDTITVKNFDVQKDITISGGKDGGDMFIYDYDYDSRTGHTISINEDGTVEIAGVTDIPLKTVTIDIFDGIGGGEGNDILNAQIGNGQHVTLQGGKGADTFNLESLYLNTDGHATITDYQAGETIGLTLQTGANTTPTATFTGADNKTLQLIFDNTGKMAITLDIVGDWTGATDATAAYNALVNGGQLNTSPIVPTP